LLFNGSRRWSFPKAIFILNPLGAENTN
jgi:hypothetical protein